MIPLQLISHPLQEAWEGLESTYILAGHKVDACMTAAAPMNSQSKLRCCKASFQLMTRTAFLTNHPNRLCTRGRESIWLHILQAQFSSNLHAGKEPHQLSCHCRDSV
jgi:hypothetical protein